MATKDITDVDVCQAVRDARQSGYRRFAHEILQDRTGQPKKVCCRAMERALSRGLIECGTSLESAWLEPAGEELLRDSQTQEQA